MLYSDIDRVLAICWDRAFGDEGVAEHPLKWECRYLEFWHMAHRYIVGDFDDPSTLRLTMEAYHEFF